MNDQPETPETEVEEDQAAYAEALAVMTSTSTMMDRGIAGTGPTEQRIDEIRQQVAAGQLNEDEAGIAIQEIRSR